ncbi:MAG: YidC/Oxa1 family rane protein insertase [Myxococcales bacterium]|nr:YidC/Oxa1 family rane protein insertase [Myxococcales bacterium]
MERSSVLRWGVIAIAILLFYKFGWPLISGQSGDKGQVTAAPVAAQISPPGFPPDRIDAVGTPPPPEGDLCTIKGVRFEAQLSSRGASLTHYYLTDANYARSEAHDLSTTPDHERWRNLRTTFRGKDAESQVKYDRFLWKLDQGDSPSDKSCKFTYEDEDVRIVKTITAHPTRAFELNVETTVTNLAAAPKRHQLTLATFAFRKNSETKGSLGRVSPFATELSCAVGKDVVRKGKDDFKAGMFTVAGVDRYAAVNSHYFSQAMVPQPDPANSAVASDAPTCGLLATPLALDPPDPDDAAAIYEANLAYPPKELAPQASATYRDIAFFGPKEREVLAHAAGGNVHLGDLLNLGFFAPVANVLVKILDFIHDHITFGNWGLAIIVMTICLRSLLFPLTYKSIKTTIAMRRLKPEVDALNKKFADDAQAKNLAMMELWKKHGVNPFGGCLPQLVQMPVWFAMYTTLQTAVEMYHTKFLWFSDLSAPDKYYVLPLLLGVFMIVQQRIVPQQGMDPMQAKMMMYMLPAVFTVMMLFLPAALGVYMLTNSLLGIGQQLAVERIAPRGNDPKGIVVTEKGSPGNKKAKAAAS